MGKTRIVEGYRGHCEYVYIFPVRNIDADPKVWPHYEKNWKKIIGVPHYAFSYGLLETMNSHTDPAIQFLGNIEGNTPDYFEEFGWNFYTKESVKAIIDDLKEILSDHDKQLKIKNQISEWVENIRDGRQFDVDELLDRELDFYSRFVKKLKVTLDSAEGYEYILFLGP